MQAHTYRSDQRKSKQAEEAIDLLMQLISVPSFSGREDAVADVLEAHIKNKGVQPMRHLNNIWALNKFFDPSLPTILLNSHIDTVRPNAGYTRDPFKPKIINGKLYGLGSNDAGASVVSQ